MEQIVTTMKENPDRENIMNAWKDYPIENAIVVIKKKKTMKVIKPKTINFCWRKLSLDVVHDFTGFATESIKEIIRDCE